MYSKNISLLILSSGNVRLLGPPSQIGYKDTTKTAHTQIITTNFFKKKIFFFIIKAKKAYYARINRIVEIDNECASMEEIVVII